MTESLAPSDNFMIPGNESMVLDTIARDAARVQVASALTLLVGIFQVRCVVLTVLGCCTLGPYIFPIILDNVDKNILSITLLLNCGKKVVVLLRFYENYGKIVPFLQRFSKYHSNTMIKSSCMEYTRYLQCTHWT